MKESHKENLKKMKKEIREDTFIDCHNKYLRSRHSTKRILQIQRNPHQNHNNILYRTRKINPKMCMEGERTAKAKAGLSRKNNSGVISIFDLKLYYKDIAAKPAWKWPRMDVQILKENRGPRNNHTQL